MSRDKENVKKNYFPTIPTNNGFSADLELQFSNIINTFTSNGLLLVSKMTIALPI